MSCKSSQKENGHSFLPSLTLHISVCTTKWVNSTVNSEHPVCETVEEEICRDDVGCKVFPRLQCSIETKNQVVMTPDTSCKSEPRQVCGPEVCPIVHGEEVCRDEVQEVGS